MVNGMDTIQVRRREIRDADVEAVACLLARGFPGRDRGYWRTGLNRMAARPALPAGCPRYGYLLETEAGPVGAVLLLCSETVENGEARIRCNASSWYTEPAYRMHAPLLIAAALKRRDVTYINVSPAPHTWPTVEAQGFRAYASGQAVVCPMLAAAREPACVLRIGPEDGEVCDPADATLLTDHAALGCTSLVVKAADGAHPFVFLPFRIRSGRYPLPLMQLIYCRDPAAFVRFAAPLGRALLRRGFPGVVLDADMPLAGLMAFRGLGSARKYFRGPHRPRIGDLAYTERVIFGA